MPSKLILACTSGNEEEQYEFQEHVETKIKHMKK